MVDCDRGFDLVNTNVSKGLLVRGFLVGVKLVNYYMKLIPADAGIGSKQWVHKASEERSIKGLCGYQDRRIRDDKMVVVLSILTSTH